MCHAAHFDIECVNYTGNGGRPPGASLQEQALNHFKLLTYWGRGFDNFRQPWYSVPEVIKCRDKPERKVGVGYTMFC